MKTAKMIFAAFSMAALMTSCTKESESNNESTNKTLEFTASWAEEDSSRTVLQEDGTSIWWNTNEEINVFIGEDASAKFISTNTKPQAIATFVGNALVGYSESSGDFPGYWAVYPYNAENTSDGNSVSLKVKSKQAAAEGTFADKCFPAVARSTNFSLAFWNVCGGARFSVVTEGVQRVVFRSNDGSPMAGKVRVDFGEDDKPQILEVTEPVDSVVLNAKDGSLVPGANYFAAMLPQMHAQGLTVTLYTATQRAVKTITKSITVHRSAFGMLDNADEGLTYMDATLPEDEDDDTPYEMVDLGLSVKWATCNVGATSPEEYGDAFAWGETEPKEDYGWETYEWCVGGYSYYAGPFTKYCTDSQYGYNGFMDNKVILDPEDDAATVNWGAKWRTPTYDEWAELQEKCTWKYTALIGEDGFSTAGYKVTSKISGYTDRWIFLPTTFAGGIRDTYFGCYWSSSLNYSWNMSTAYSVDLSTTQPQGASSRRSGHSVRPVYGGFVHVNGVSVSPDNATVYYGESLQLTAAINPSNALDKRLNWSSSNTSVATVSSEGVVTAISPGTTEITVSTVDGGYSATCTIDVTVEYQGFILNYPSNETKSTEFDFNAMLVPGADVSVNGKSYTMDGYFIEVPRVAQYGICYPAGSMSCDENNPSTMIVKLPSQQNGIVSPIMYAGISTSKSSYLSNPETINLVSPFSLLELRLSEIDKVGRISISSNDALSGSFQLSTDYYSAEDYHLSVIEASYSIEITNITNPFIHVWVMPQFLVADIRIYGKDGRRLSEGYFTGTLKRGECTVLSISLQ